MTQNGVLHIAARHFVSFRRLSQRITDLFIGAVWFG